MKILSASKGMKAFLLCTLLAGAAPAAAVPVTIGNAPAISNSVDSGTPTNVDRNNPIVLAAGTYNVNEFNSALSSVDGVKSIIPFLVTGTPSTYTTIWVGPGYVPTINGVQNVLYTPDSQQFTLLAPATVYAAATTVGGALLDFNGGGTTDHQGTPGFGPPVLNGVFTVTSNPGLGRTYSLNFVVDEYVPPPAPEPTSVSLVGLGLLSLMRYRRGRRQRELLA